MISGQLLAVDGGLLTGFGEDLRPIVRKRMADAKAAAAAKKQRGALRTLKLGDLAHVTI